MEALKKLGNKITYKINELVTNPEAEAVAAEKERNKAIKEKQEEEKQEEKQEEAVKAKEIEEKEAEENKSDWDIIKEIGTTTVVSVIGVFMILIFGSIVSNMSIHRHIAIRMLYFIYGAIGGSILITFAIGFPPLMIIGIIINAILYITGHLPHWYAFIPLTTTPPSDNFIARLFKAPFYWNPESPDHREPYLNAMSKYKEFLESQLMSSGKK